MPKEPIPNPAPMAHPTARSTEDMPMTAEQAARLRQLTRDAYELDAFGPHLTQAEAERRIATLAAKLKLLDEPPHTL
jgi:hypothetical protein